ncbi:MAG: tetratricopeptide repeat protein [Deltaproteobacteria bacterium]|nr:tetratricopeptide repeat protein [Deltaproteobacteria bacterium]
MQEGPPEVTTAETRRLAAIMFTDIVGFSRQMGSNEARTLRLLEVHNHVIQQAVTEHHGHVIKTVGDAFLVDFPSVVHAVQCAQHIHTQFRTHNAEKEPTEQIHMRIGIHSGDIVQKEGDVFGDGVNIASRLQALAEPDTICISHVVYQEVAQKLDLGTVVSLGRPKLKNIAQRFPVYALLPEQPQGLRQTLRRQRLKLSRRVGTAHLAWAALIAMGLLIGGGIVTFLFPSYSPFRIPHSAIRTQEAQPPLLPLPDKPSIVVLPFDNMSGDPQQDYFSNGITEVLTSDLSRISSLFVIARNTAFTYKGKATNVQEVGKELGVRYALEGSVQRTSDQVRIVAQLIDTTTGGHLWSERYDRPLKDIFALQDEIVQKIVTTLKLQLFVQEQGLLVRKHTDNLEAYDTFLRGADSYYRLTKEGNAQARSLFEKTIELDSQYAEAHVFLGLTYLIAWIQQWSPDPQTLQRAFELGQQALVLDDSLPRAHILLSWVYMFQAKYEPAVTEAERAIALDPNNTDGYHGLAVVLNNFGERTTEAIELEEQAIRLNPHYPFEYPFQLGWAYRLAGRYEEAITAQKQALLRNPNWQFSHAELSASYRLLWNSQQTQDPQTLDRALEAAQQIAALDTSSPFAHFFLSWAYLSKKQYEQASTETERVLALNPSNGRFYPGLASMLTFLGRPEDASGLIEKALRLSPLLPPELLLAVGHTYYLTRRPEEAIAVLKRSFNGTPADLGAHLLLAAVYSELSKDAEAQTEVAEVLRINPNWSLEIWKQRVPYKDPAMLERVFAALRKAGLK